MLFDVQDPALLYEPAAGELGTIVVRVDFSTKIERERVVTNAVRTGGLVQPGDQIALLLSSVRSHARAMKSKHMKLAFSFVAFASIVFVAAFGSYAGSHPAIYAATERQALESAKDFRETVTGWGGLAFTVLTVFVLVMQTRVFFVQAKRLRQTIKKMDEVAQGQTGDMQAYIKEAIRSATAMESVAQSMELNAISVLDSVATSKEIAARQKLVASLQLRAYLTIVTGGCAPQVRETGVKVEVRQFIHNTGQTPASEVSVTAHARIMPIPLPEDFDPSNFPEGAPTSSHIGAHQQFYLRAILPEIVDDELLKRAKRWEGVAIYVFGHVSYRDVFDERHRTNFLQICTWDTKDLFGTINLGSHNETT